jgi:hypothetical protein
MKFVIFILLVFLITITGINIGGVYYLDNIPQHKSSCTYLDDPTTKPIVSIIPIDLEKNAVSTGSGIVISPRVIITARHVIEDQSHPTSVIINYNEYNYKKIQTAHPVDILESIDYDSIYNPEQEIPPEDFTSIVDGMEIVMMSDFAYIVLEDDLDIPVIFVWPEPLEEKTYEIYAIGYPMTFPVRRTKGYIFGFSEYGMIYATSNVVGGQSGGALVTCVKGRWAAVGMILANVTSPDPVIVPEIAIFLPIHKVIKFIEMSEDSIDLRIPYEDSSSHDEDGRGKAIVREVLALLSFFYQQIH